MYSGEYDACDVTQSVLLISKELDSVPKYHILEPTWPRSSVGRAEVVQLAELVFPFLISFQKTK